MQAANPEPLHRQMMFQASPDLLDDEFYTKKLPEICEQLAHHLQRTNVDLANARRRPFRVLRDNLLHKTLKGLLKLNLPFSQKRINRLRHSAAKRDPLRSAKTTIAISSDVKVRYTSEATKPSREILKQIDSSKQTVIVVTHDATRTGGPVLALNVAWELSKKCNVISVILGDGPLIDDFRRTSVEVLELNSRLIDESFILSTIQKLQKSHDIKYAIVNTVESRMVLAPLREANIPSVSLVHEFAANTRPASTFPEVFSKSDSVVFSSDVTLWDAAADAISNVGLGRPTSTCILPQGKCIVPTEDMSAKKRAKEQAWIDDVMGKASKESDAFVVMGAGTLQLRKGLELFIEVANRARKSGSKKNFRFVWFGHGYNPQNGTELSVSLADQMLRAGLRGQLQIVRPTSEIEHAYAKADVLLLTSRLDPLPNVAIDAILAGTPVICFDRTTGIADFLTTQGLGQSCVAKYLDTNDMADKLVALAQDDGLRDKTARQAQAVGKTIFDFPKYIDKLDAVASEVIPFKQQINQDTEFLRNCSELRSDFFPPIRSKDDDENGDPISAYAIATRTGIATRKAMPGFHPAIYAEHHGSLTGTDPFVDFIKAGKPEGPWSFPVVRETSKIEISAITPGSVALHLHVFYVEELTAILQRLNENASRPDLFVSTSRDKMDAVRSLLADYDGRVVKIEATPNRGRDIGPFLTAFGKELVADYEIIGHLHTKKSPHVEDTGVVAAWSNFLLENLLGGTSGGAMLDRILTEMASDRDIGIVYPDDPNVMGWKENEALALDLAERLKIGKLPFQFNFPMGTMFWIRNNLLERFVSLELDWSDFPAEPLPHHDGTILHALERLFGVLPGHMNMKTVVTNVRGITR